MWRLFGLKPSATAKKAISCLGLWNTKCWFSRPVVLQGCDFSVWHCPSLLRVVCVSRRRSNFVGGCFIVLHEADQPLMWVWQWHCSSAKWKFLFAGGVGKYFEWHKETISIRIPGRVRELKKLYLCSLTCKFARGRYLHSDWRNLKIWVRLL